MKCLVENDAVTQWPLNETHIRNRWLQPPQVREITPVIKPVVNDMLQVVYERKPIMHEGEPLQVWEVQDHPVPEAANRTNAAMVEFYNTLLFEFTADTLSSEPLSWGVKGPAARAYEAGTANELQTLMIEAEAEAFDETPAQLVERIKQNELAYTSVIAVITGHRRKVKNRLEAAAVADMMDIMRAAKAEAMGYIKAYTGEDDNGPEPGF